MEPVSKREFEQAMTRIDKRFEAIEKRFDAVEQTIQDEILMILEKSGDWYFVETRTGRRGYIHTSVVRVSARTPTAPTSTLIATSPKAQPPVNIGPVTNADVIAMSRAGLSADVIIGTLNNAESINFDLSPSELVSLKHSGVDNQIIQLMVTLENGLTADPTSPQRETFSDGQSQETLRQTVATAAAPVQDSERREWSTRLERAREEVSDSKKLVLVGLGMFGGSLLIAKWNLELGTVTFMAGGGLAAYGGINIVRAQARVRTIESEGRQKGFAFILAPDRTVASYALAF